MPSSPPPSQPFPDGPVPNTRVAHDQKRPASPTWYGGIMVGSIAAMAAILLTYTLFDWAWQQRLGVWNYVAAVLLIPFTTVFMLTWQPDETL